MIKPDLTSHATQYNRLPLADIAEQALQSRDSFHDFFQDAKDIVADHDLKDIIGFRLIHRHFDLTPSHVMLEEFRMYEGTPSLVTSPCDVKEAEARGAVPSSWILSGPTPTCFEFSTDAAVKAGIERIQAAEGFLDQMQRLLKEYDLQNILAVAILKRAALVPGNGQVYKETDCNDTDSRIIQLVDRDIDPAELRTTWSFDGPPPVCCLKM